MDEKQSIEQRLRIENEVKGSASWFYWIAALSILNSIIFMFNLNWNFVIGLGVTQLLDFAGRAFSDNFISGIKYLSLSLNIILSAVFIVIGLYANKASRKAFIIGMILYGLDTIVFILAFDLLGIGFHIFAIYFMFRGFQACAKMKNIINTEETAEK
ncbi:TPA: hypothetical protein DCW38_04390 [candidate division WOR-3 bacterium]|uniref:DUF2127 domain-containing protein n=1 Tax=candidate division WOR-3 bacterium TaxID=2052148 RepID=A0A350HA35_UNCW3|nr:hypothetical protein [candidate division WOR-3 bacterium]